MTSPARESPGRPAVLVVGAGPVGLVAACELARRQVPVRVVDRLLMPTEESRAILLHARSLEMLERIGVVDQLIASGLRCDGLQVHDRNRMLADLPFGSVDSPYPFSITTAQTETERILRGLLAELGISVEQGVELVDLHQDESAVHCRLRHRDGHLETASTGWVIGTDGSRSTVRAQTGQRLEGSFQGERFLLGDVDATYDLQRDRMHSFFGVGGGPLLIFPMLGPRVRVVAQITDGNDEATLPRLQSLIDERTSHFQIGSARWLKVFEIHHAQVPQYRVGRVFLAGDAAHVHSPAGGQGMNTGMQDAFNLVWKLASVADGVAGTAAEKLLDSYQAERHPVAARVIRQTTRVTAMGTLDSRPVRVLRNASIRQVSRLSLVRRSVAEQFEESGLGYRNSPIVSPSGRRDGLRPGDQAPDVGGTGLHRLLATLTGTVAITFGPIRDDAVAAVAGLRRIQVVTDSADRADRAIGGDVEARTVQLVDDADGRVSRRYRAATGDVVLVRPDGYVGFVGSSLDHGFAAAVTAYRSATGCSTASPHRMSVDGPEQT